MARIGWKGIQSGENGVCKERQGGARGVMSFENHGMAVA